MADLLHTVSVVFSREDRGKTAVQWRVSAEEAHRIAAEFRARFGDPIAESTSDADVIDGAVRYMNEHPGHVFMDLAGD